MLSQEKQAQHMPSTQNQTVARDDDRREAFALAQSTQRNRMKPPALNVTKKPILRIQGNRNPDQQTKIMFIKSQFNYSCGFTSARNA